MGTVNLSAPGCVERVADLRIEGDSKLRADCASVEQRRHPELGLEPWVHVRNVHTGEVHENVLHADRAWVIEAPELQEPQEPPDCASVEGLIAGEEFSRSMTDILSLPDTPATYEVHVAFGRTLSNKVRVRVAGPGGCGWGCD